MKRIYIVILFIFLASCKPDNYVRIDKQEISPQNSHSITTYYMNAYLDPIEGKLSVSQRIYFINPFNDLDNIALNTYANAVGGNKLNIESFHIDGISKSFEWTDSDQQSFNVDLDSTLLTNDILTIDIVYTLTYWDEGRFSHMNGDFISMFFYPSIAYYEDGEWQTDKHSFIGESYYNKVANYFVNLELDSDYVLSTGGDISNTKRYRDTNVYQIQLFAGRDYSFSASRSYITHQFHTNYTSVTIQSKTQYSIEEIEHIEQLTKDTLAFMSNLVGPYIYQSLTLEFGDIYGMESSSIVYCDTNISDVTVVHEIIHQWFYSMIGNNQADESWVDEGLTSFVTGLFFEEYNHYLDWDYFDWYTPKNPRYQTIYVENLNQKAQRNIHEYSNNYGLLIYTYGSNIFNHYYEIVLNSDIDLLTPILQKYYENYLNDEASIENLIDLIVDESILLEPFKNDQNLYRQTFEEYFYNHLESFQEIELILD